MKRITPDNITSLNAGEIFVFGSNLAGRHGAGAARYALDHFGAVYGQAVGIQGQSYAIPTLNADFSQRTVEEIGGSVNRFIEYAKKNAETIFYVTAIGCGIAGMTPEQIAPLFKECINLTNIYLPNQFLTILSK